MTSSKQILISPDNARYERHLPDADLNIEVRNEGVIYVRGGDSMDSTESSELIRNSRRKRLVFDFFIAAVMVVVIPGICFELWLQSNNSSWDFALKFLSIISLGFWTVLFLFSRYWFKTKVSFDVTGDAPQLYWRYRYGLTRLFGADHVKQVLHREKLDRDFKYNFNAGESIYTDRIHYGNSRSVDLDFNIEVQAIERNPNSIGEFLRGFSRRSEPSRQISPTRLLFRIALAAVMFYCGFLIMSGKLPFFTVLSLLFLAFFFQWNSLKNKESLGNRFLDNHSKIRWGLITILVLCTFYGSLIISGLFNNVSMDAYIDDMSLVSLILIGILALWLYSEIYFQKAWFILPNGIYESNSCNFYPYKEIIDSSKLTYGEFLKDDPIPSDASIIGYIWEHQNLDGGPDLRFKSNFQKANLHMGYVSLASDSGLDLILQVSDWYKAAEFARFWTSCDLNLTADNYLFNMLASCAVSGEVISDTIGFDWDQFKDLDPNNASHGNVNLPEELTVLIIETAAHIRLPREINGLVDSLISRNDGNVFYPDELTIRSGSYISPDLLEAPTLIFSDGRIKLIQSSSPISTLDDIPLEQSWRPSKYTWAMISTGLVLASTAISVIISDGNDDGITMATPVFPYKEDISNSQSNVFLSRQATAETTATSLPLSPVPTSAPIEKTATSLPLSPVPTSAPIETTATSLPLSPVPTSAPIETTATSLPSAPVPTSAPIEKTATSLPSAPVPNFTVNTISHEEQYSDLQLADVDGDGDLDAIFLSPAGNRNQKNQMTAILDTWLYEKDGVFTYQASAVLSCGRQFSLSYRGSVKLGDLDNDGDLDAVAGCGGILLNNGEGIFNEIEDPGTYGWGEINIGDLDNDGDIDFLIKNDNSPPMVFLNPGLTKISEPMSWVAWYYDYTQATDLQLGNVEFTSMRLDDLNDDGRLDVISEMRSPRAGTLVHLSNGNITSNGSMYSSKDIYIIQPNPTHWLGNAITDIDNDGDKDIVSWNLEYSAVFLNPGEGLFPNNMDGKDDVEQLRRKFRGSFTIFTDFDGDGDQDALSISENSESIWLNPGLEFFQSAYPVDLELGGEPGGWWVAAVGDIDGDGDSDAIICCKENKFKVLMNN